MIEPDVTAQQLPEMGDREKRRAAPAREDAETILRRHMPALFIVDEFLNVLYHREDPHERRQECRMPNAAALPPLVERTVIALLRRSLAGESQTGVLTASADGSVAVRVARLDGRNGAAYAVIVERVRMRRHLHAVAQRFGLSARERQVLDLVAKGAKNSEIAARLSIAESTAIFHVKRLLTKTNSRNRTELVAKIIG